MYAGVQLRQVDRTSFKTMFGLAMNHAKLVVNKQAKTLEEKALKLMLHWYNTGLEYMLDQWDAGFVAAYNQAAVWCVFLRKEHERIAKAHFEASFDKFIEKAFSKIRTRTG